LKLEESIAQFFGKEDGVYFSSGVATVSSITTALLVEDSIAFFPSNAHYGFKAGIRLNSLGTIKFYDNLDELEQLITDQSGKKLYSCNFVFAEGMSQNNGEIVDLPKLIQLKEKHKLILVLEETNALGFIGARGSIDYWNKKIKNPFLKYSISDIDIIMGSLEQAIG
jgi:serine palmitoyltransferase